MIVTNTCKEIQNPLFINLKKAIVSAAVHVYCYLFIIVIIPVDLLVLLLGLADPGRQLVLVCGRYNLNMLLLFTM